MAESTNKEVKSGKANIVLAFATLGLLATSIVGLILIRHELIELRRQNNYLERTMKQTYRPLGIVRYSQDLSDSTFNLSYIADAKPGKFSFKCNPILFNQGKGVLSFLGSLSFIASRQINFRDEFLEGHLDTVAFDRLKAYARRSPVMPDAVYKTTVRWDNLDFDTIYYLHILFLYEDQDGTLYDTEHLDIIEFQERPRIIDSTLIPKLKESGYYSREVYHYYTLEERTMLVQAIQKLGHPLADVIASGY